MAQCCQHLFWENRVCKFFFEIFRRQRKEGKVWNSSCPQFFKKFFLSAAQADNSNFSAQATWWASNMAGFSGKGCDFHHVRFDFTEPCPTHHGLSFNGRKHSAPPSTLLRCGNCHFQMASCLKASTALCTSSSPIDWCLVHWLRNDPAHP